MVGELLHHGASIVVIVIPGGAVGHLFADLLASTHIRLLLREVIQASGLHALTVKELLHLLLLLLRLLRSGMVVVMLLHVSLGAVGLALPRWVTDHLLVRSSHLIHQLLVIDHSLLVAHISVLLDVIDCYILHIHSKKLHVVLAPVLDNLLPVLLLLLAALDPG